MASPSSGRASHPVRLPASSGAVGNAAAATVLRDARVGVVDALRGIASLAVCWYHFVYADHAFLGTSLVSILLRLSAQDAWMGVDVFFVISGFVIPFALYRARYSIGSFWTFLARRLLRLDPPYLVSALLCLALWFIWAAVPHLHGPSFDPKITPLLLHIGYLNAFFGQQWLNPVYWTLAIEFQYYVAMGVVFGLLAGGWRGRWAVFVAMAVLALAFPETSLLFHYLFVFMLGMATFQYFAGIIGRRTFGILLALLTAGTAITLGLVVAALALVTALLIAFVRRDIRPLVWLGTISYSLYLIHVPVGGRILGFGLAHVHSGPARVAVLALSLILTIAAAGAFYRLVERPAQRWSKSVRYRREAPAAAEMPVMTGIAEP
ncbi:MAG TPA: acyltransferase [Chloroflexota bacterium]|nr:acyltransferase [Chloroflexota bacterium]